MWVVFFSLKVWQSLAVCTAAANAIALFESELVALVMDFASASQKR
jgi:hypothetical protein